MAIGPKRVTAGTPFKPSASSHNAMSDFIRQHQGGRTGGGDSRPGRMPGSLVVLVRNDTGGDLPSFSVLFPDSAIINSAVDSPHQTQAEPVFSGVAPTGNTDPIVVTVEPIRAGKLGDAVIGGVVVVDVNVNDAGHDFAEPSTSTALLQTAATGPARILWREAGSTGIKRAVVLLSGKSGSATNGEFVRGKLDGALSFGGSATLSIWHFNGTSEVDTTENVTVFDWLLVSGGTIALGTNVVASWDARSERYYVTGASCP